ncbi:MAG: YlxR family protein [Alicyclobacillus sp.]|nr:YlxR family protein [Alicyclobacillus sp.]
MTVQRVRKVPLRKCVGCQEMKAKRDLLRIVLSPDGEVFLDPTGKKSGRGAYVCSQISCLQLARKKRALERALKTSVPDSVYSRLAAQMQGLAPDGAGAEGAAGRPQPQEGAGR